MSEKKNIDFLDSLGKGPVKHLTGNSTVNHKQLAEIIVSYANKNGGEISWRSSGKGNYSQADYEKQEFIEMLNEAKKLCKPLPAFYLNEYDDNSDNRYIVVDISKGKNKPYRVLKYDRSRKVASALDRNNKRKIIVKDIIVDENDLTGVIIKGKRVDLQREKAAAFAALAKSPNQFVSNELIELRVNKLLKIADRQSNYNYNLRTYISVIRGAVRPIVKRNLIKNVRHEGYRLDCDKNAVKYIPLKKQEA